LQVASPIPHPYSESDIGFLLHVVKQLALVLENTFAYEELNSLKEQLARENVYLKEKIKSQNNHEEIIDCLWNLDPWIISRIPSIACCSCTNGSVSLQNA